jgi:cell surface protein SprA
MHSIWNLGSPLSYSQRARLSYELPFKNIPALNWISSSSVTYSAGYKWDRGAYIEGVDIGNTISNDATLELRGQFDLAALYNKSGFLKRINQRFDTQRRQSPTQRQQQVRQQRPERKRYTQIIALKRDTTYTLTHNLGTKDIQVLARKDGKAYSLKFKKLDDKSILITNKDSANIQVSIETKVKDPSSSKLFADITEYSARGLMAIRNIEFTYSKRRDTYISGFKPGIGDMFGQKDSEYGLVPGLGFAFGLEGGEDFIQKSMGRGWLVMDENNITPAIYNNAEKFELKSQIVPFKDFIINLNVAREKNDRTEVQYMFDGMPRSLGGSFSMTTIALSTSLKSSNSKNNYYSKAFSKFLENRNVISNRLEDAYRGTEYQGGEYQHGGVNRNSSDVLIPAFIAAYTGRDAGSISLSAFPSFFSMLPNWSISYAGLQKIPFIKEKFRNLQLNHSYECRYQIGSYGSFSGWVQAGGTSNDDLGFIRDVLTGSPIPSSPYNVSSVNITEIFKPLIGVDASLNNNMEIKLDYNNSRILTLNMSSYQLMESLEKEFTFNFGYRINEFNRVIGLTSRTPKNFNNDLNIKAGISHKTREVLLRKIEENFTQGTEGVTIFSLKLSADYTLSRALTLRAFYDRILNKPLISLSYPTTNSNMGISLKFTLIQ